MIPNPALDYIGIGGGTFIRPLVPSSLSRKELLCNTLFCVSSDPQLREPGSFEFDHLAAGKIQCNKIGVCGCFGAVASHSFDQQSVLAMARSISGSSLLEPMAHDISEQPHASRHVSCV